MCYLICLANEKIFRIDCNNYNITNYDNNNFDVNNIFNEIQKLYKVLIDNYNFLLNNKPNNKVNKLNIDPKIDEIIYLYQNNYPTNNYLFKI